MKKFSIFLIILIISLTAVFLSWQPLEAAVMHIINSVRITNGLVGYWSLDGPTVNWGTGVVTDLSGNSNTGQLIGSISTSTAPVPGMVGQAIQFDGVNDQVKIQDSNSLDLTSEVTMAMWIKTSTTVVRNLFNHSAAGEGFGFRVGGITAGVLDYRGPGGWFGDTSSTTVNDGNWHQVAVTYDDTNKARFYKDGAYTGNNTNAPAPTTTTADALIGGTTGVYFDGPIDEVRVYNRALSASEIEYLYKKNAKEFGNKIKSPNNNGLVGFWNFDDCDSCNNAGDMSGSGRPGTMYTTCATGAGNLHAAGKIGNAADFDGSNDCILLGALPVTQPFTMSFWMKPDSVGSDERIICPRDEVPAHEAWCLSLGDSSNHLRMWDGASWLNLIGAILSAGNWYHVTITVDSSKNVQAYINGVGYSSVLSDGATFNVSTLSLGSQYIGLGAYYNGILDEVRIYNRALSASEIKDYYDSTKLGYRSHTTINAPQTNFMTSGLVGFWSFDGPTMLTGAVLDVSGNNNTGSLMGGHSTTTQRVAGMVGQAIQFDGVNDQVAIPDSNSLDLTSEVTMAMWIKTSTTVVRNLFNHSAANEGFGFRVGGITAGVLDYRGPGGWFGDTSSTTVNDGNWHQVAVTYDDTNKARFYKDGAYTGNNTNAPAPTTTTADAAIGGFSGVYFDGPIDEVRVYNRALSAAEIYELYRSGKR